MKHDSGSIFLWGCFNLLDVKWLKLKDIIDLIFASCNTKTCGKRPRRVNMQGNINTWLYSEYFNQRIPLFQHLGTPV